MVRIFKGSCLAKRILAVVSQQGLVLVSMAVGCIGAVTVTGWCQLRVASSFLL